MTPTPDRTPDWQPIETAPKDGRRLLVFATEFKHGYYGCCRWVSYSDKSSGWSGSSFLSVPEGAWTTFLQPSHWMPLPAPPEPHREQE